MRVCTICNINSASWGEKKVRGREERLKKEGRREKKREEKGGTEREEGEKKTSLSLIKEMHLTA